MRAKWLEYMVTALLNNQEQSLSRLMLILDVPESVRVDSGAAVRIQDYTGTLRV